MKPHETNVSIVIPAKNEAKSLKLFLPKLRATYPDFEVILVNDGSTDDTSVICKETGVKEIKHPYSKGNGAAIKAGAREASRDIIVFMDADHAFYAHQAMDLIDGIAKGRDLVIGSRVLGKMQPGALTAPQKFGNQLASQLIQLIWREKVTDLGPFRAVSQKALDKLAMQDQTFGWTIEMQIKAFQYNLSVSEVAVDTRRRIGVSKISGTIKGTIGAGIGILGMIAKLWWNQKKMLAVMS